MPVGGTPKLGRVGTGDADLQAGSELERRLLSIEVELKTLHEVPGQLRTMLDVLEKLQAHLESPVPPGHRGEPAPGLEQGASGQGLQQCSSPRHRSQPRPSRSSGTPTSMCSDASPRRGSKHTASSTRPLIGLPAPPAELSAGWPGMQQRRPSTQSDDPRAMAISEQRRRPSMGNILEASRQSAHTAVGPARAESTHVMPPPANGQTRRASTCSDISARQLARMDPVMPNCMPEEEPEPDAETRASADLPEQSMLQAHWDAKLDTFAEGDHGAAAAYRESINSDFSLGGDRRHSQGLNSSQEGSVVTLGRDDEGLGVEKWVLHPSSCVRVSWDLCMVFLAIVVGTVVSVAMCYHGDDLAMDCSYVVFLNIVSSVWWLDIALNFWTGFYQSEKLVRSPRKVALRYLRSWLVPDLLSAVPLVMPSAAAMRAIGGIKLVRVARLGPLILGGQQDHRLLGLPMRVGISVLITTIGMTCAWRLTLHADEARGTEVTDPTADWGELFVSDMYWVAMTMSTVGFGDIAPSGTFSRLFAILAMLVAPIFFGTIVSLLTHVTQSIFNDEIEIQVAEANRFMQQRGLPSQLQRRVEHNLRYQIRQERLTLKPALFGKLSTAVQREISLELLRNSVLKFPLFRGVLHSFIAEIAQAHTWVQCVTGDLVVEEGQLIQEIVFVIRGRMQMHDRAEDMDELAIDEDDDEASRPPPEFELGAGAWFSESALFFSDQVRTVTVYAAADSELAVLLSSDYHRIVQKYPRLLKRHQGIAKSLQRGELSLRDLAYKRPMEPLASHGSWRDPRSPWDWLRRPFSEPC